MGSKKVEMGELYGLRITAERSAAVAAGVIWIVTTLLGLRVWRLRPRAALFGGLLTTGLHFFGELWHQLGHAHAARRTGYPMAGMHFWTGLARSVYPGDEPELPAAVHVSRALGGPRASLLMTTVSAVLALLLWPLRSAVSMAVTLFALDNLTVFTLGALLPLPWLGTDGHMLLKYGRRPRRMIVVQE